MKKTLAQTNPYLKDPRKRAALLRRQAINSSAFEGIRGLGNHSVSVKAASSASAKKDPKR